MGFLKKERLFWTEALTIAGSALPLVMPRALLFGLFALAVTAVDLNTSLPDLNIEITPFEVAGGVLSLLLVLRTNAGYERWWEGRRIWGDIVNRSRNLAVAALSYGPDDPAWRRDGSSAARPRSPTPRGRASAASGSAEGARPADRPGEAERVLAADHMPYGRGRTDRRVPPRRARPPRPRRLRPAPDRPGAHRPDRRHRRLRAHHQDPAPAGLPRRDPPDPHPVHRRHPVRPGAPTRLAHPDRDGADRGCRCSPSTRSAPSCKTRSRRTASITSLSTTSARPSRGTCWRCWTSHNP